MRKIYLLSIGILFVNLAGAQIINIPDSNLKAKLLSANSTNTIASVGGQGYVAIDTNGDGEIEAAEAEIISFLDVSSSSISSLQGISSFTGLTNLDCSHNQLTTIDTGSQGAYLFLNCSFNNLTSFDFSSFQSSLNLNCSNNHITALDFSNVQVGLSINCSNNELTSLDFSPLPGGVGELNCSNNPLVTINLVNSHNIIDLAIDNTLITSLDFSGQTQIDIFNCENNVNLTSINMKAAIGYTVDGNFDVFSTFFFDNNPNLQYVCVSEDRIAQVQQRLNQYGYDNVVLNSYCMFSPGGLYNSVTGNFTFDCGGNNSPAPNIPMTVSQGIQNTSVYSNTAGNFIAYAPTGNVTVTPQLPIAGYFSITPSNFTYDFTTTGETINSNFCLSPNGVHPDLEINLLPLASAIPGFSPTYQLILTNNGNQSASGTMSMTFDDAVMDFTSAAPSVFSQVGNLLTWNYGNLMPFQSVSVNVTMHLNAPTDTPPANSGTVLNFVASVGNAGDETPGNNTFTLNQTVGNPFDPNDKTCLEGNIVGPEMIGEYVHYMIRFENDGTANAQNIVVKDLIDTSKFDVSTLIPISGSHPFETRISDTNKVEFIFQNINLPFNDTNNDGYVAFKIKTKPTLTVGDSFSNSANIYFDYNFPIVTNIATTTIQQLGTNDFEFSKYFTLYPNPAKHVLNIRATDSVQMKSISVYNMLGQLLIAVTNAEKISEIDVSNLEAGNYFIRINSDKGSSTGRFVKE